MLSDSNIHYDIDGRHSGISCGGIGIVDGTITPTTGGCKEGMDISYDGQCGYHPPVVSLAGTREPLASSPSSATGMKTPLLGIAAGMLFVGLILVVLIYFDVHEQLIELLEWIDAQGAMATVFFILLMAAVVVLLLPGIFLTTGAGFVFGVIEGTVLVVAGTVIGAALAFLIARHLFGERASRFIVSRSNLQVISDEMARHDLKVVMLTRLIPFFPSKISNYFFGLTRFTFKGFVLGSLIGFIPFSLHNVYLGSITADLASLSRGEVERSPLQWAFYGLGFVATIVALLYFNNLARRALAAYSQESGSVQGGKPVPEAGTAAGPAKGSS